MGEFCPSIEDIISLQSVGIAEIGISNHDLNLPFNNEYTITVSNKIPVITENAIFFLLLHSQSKSNGLDMKYARANNTANMQLKTITTRDKQIKFSANPNMPNTCIERPTNIKYIMFKILYINGNLKSANIITNGLSKTPRIEEIRPSAETLI